MRADEEPEKLSQLACAHAYSPNHREGAFCELLRLEGVLRSSLALPRASRRSGKPSSPLG
jgi:hypothetical protein